MKCHYEVLGVGKDVSDEELKKTYRKLALQWHPDKNLDNPDEAKEQFQLIQQAFEVISDPQERAWYDAHREAILKGGLGSDFKDDSFDVFPYFTSSCYKGFGDDDKGFYSVYREVFSKIAAEEADLHSENSDSDCEIPTFGESTSSYEEVVHAFYAYWQSFSTRKSYAWMDQYDTRQAENRRVVRAMEKENKKFRDKARKDRNEQVRALVAFVKKRDKRMEQYRVKLAEKSRENALKVENARKRHIAERKKLLDEAKASNAMKMDDMEGVLKEIESQVAAEFGDSCSGADASDTDSEEVPSGFFCVACNKNFKTEKAFANHENSKKHKENVAALKTVLQEEEGTDADAKDSAGSVEEEDIDLSDHIEVSLSSDDEPVVQRKIKKNKKKVAVEVGSSDAGSEGSPDLEEVGISKKQRRKKGAAQAQVSNPISEPSQSEPSNVEGAVGEEGAVGPGLAEPRPSQAKAKGKKAKSARQAVRKSSIDPSAAAAAAAGTDISHTCVTCNSTFQSRNKLFDHFKKTGHSVPLSHSLSSKGLSDKKKKSKQ